MGDEMNTTLLIRTIAPILGAGALAWIGFFLFHNVRIGSTASRHLHQFRPAEIPRSKHEQVGDLLLERLPFALDLDAWETHLRWAQRGGHYPGWSIGRVAFQAMLYALGGCAIVFMNPAPLFFIIPVIAAYFPFVMMRSRANRVRRQVIRALPEAAALTAAEIAANNPPDQALARAAELPGPLAGLIADAVSHAQKSGRPLFSREPVRGALVEVFYHAGLPELRAFASQMDLVAHHGVDSAELMNDTAKTLAREYRERVLMEKEQLDSKLTTAIAFHFFFPAVGILLLALLVPMIQMFTGG